MKFCSKECNNLYKIQTAARLAGLISHSDTEQIYFIDFIYIYTYTYIHTHTYIHTYA